MLYTHIFSNKKRYQWILVFLTPSVFLLTWFFLLKPYEVKRLKTETTQTADKIIDGFSSQARADLAALEQLFLWITHYAQRDSSTLWLENQAALIQRVNYFFKQVSGLETFVFPPLGQNSALVLFNPYVMLNAYTPMEQEACVHALAANTSTFQTYKTMTLVSLDDKLCVFSSNHHMFAILNLKTMLDETLKIERMKGYFLALLEDQLPEWLSSKERFAWVQSRLFSFLGTKWTIYVYPNGAYREASFKRIFLSFCLFSLGGGIVWWFFRRYRTIKTAPDAAYVAHLKQLALFDSVTNLPNRRHCIDHLNLVLKRAVVAHQPFSVCFMDCDNFKKINDDYGHATGDRVLRHIADKVSELIRSNDFFARFSGDEFCLILENTTKVQDLEVVLNKILRAIAEPVLSASDVLHISMSIGVAIYPQSGQTVDSLLKHADDAMYQAKRDEKNKYIIYQGNSPRPLC